MKVTFMEEIEIHKAWREIMFCPQCSHMTYKVHHQLQPKPEEWWVECPYCGYETSPAGVREAAIARWKQRRLV